MGENFGKDERHHCAVYLCLAIQLHPIYRLIESFAVWEESGHQEFESGMSSALDALDDLYELSLEENWNSVASYSLLKSIEFREELGGFDPADQFEDVLDFLNSNFLGESDVHLGQLGTHVRKMLEHLDKMDDVSIQSLLQLVEDRAQHLRENKRYMTERDYLEYQITIKSHLDKDISDEQVQMIESFENELEQKNSAQSLLKADILERAVATCQPYLSDEKENRWRLRIRELNREAVNEMPGIEHEVDVGDDVSRIVERFKEVREETSSWEALAMLLYAPIGQGNFEKSLENAGETPAA
ncbi:hypothetical protein [Halorubrum luteum]